ncbi:MAG: DUF59 domain-containing protein [Bacteroidales bacterium]|nr:DUF59 domain-containing protein [Bacteroidales bacterium]MBN2758417.1 DUF59 domain-containing protein [Bacteroidales bacterium]
MKTIEEVVAELRKVGHPAIDYSLIELGILTDIDLENNKVDVVFAFPFPNIPIADQLINSVAIPVKNMGLEFNYSIRGMNDEEKTMFMTLESQGWKDK